MAGPAVSRYPDACSLTMSDQAGRDTRMYPICGPWFGVKGPEFTRRFAPDFISGLATVKDDYSNLQRHLAGNDPGGTPPGAAGPNPHAGNAPLDA